MMTIILDDPDAIVSGGAIGAWSGVFDFEADFAHDLRCIPMCVRFKLDRVGIKLSLRQWSKIGPSNRRTFATLRCDTRREAKAWRSALIRAVTEARSGPMVELPSDPDPAWMETARVPAQVITEATKAGVAAPSPVQWTSLGPLQRFALLKLARSNHDNHNFAPALREFGIL